MAAQSDIEAMTWFKNQFGQEIKTAIAGTPFTLSMLTALARQESYDCWRSIYKTLPVKEVLKLCVGDTLDVPRRSAKAWPANKAEMLKSPNGDKLFAVAREALESIAKHSGTYANVVKKYPDKFCHGFGIFQYDIQFFKVNPDYFLKKQWYGFDSCLARCISELKSSLARAYPPGNKKTLTKEEKVYVAISYNIGNNVKVGAGFKQGHWVEVVQNGTKIRKYYGEYIDEFLTVAESIPD